MNSLLRVIVFLCLSVSIVQCRPRTRTDSLESEAKLVQEDSISTSIQEYVPLADGLNNADINSFYIAPNRPEVNKKGKYRSKLTACKDSGDYVFLQEYIVRDTEGIIQQKFTGRPFVSLCAVVERRQDGGLNYFMSVQHGSGSNEIARMQWEENAITDNGDFVRNDFTFKLTKDPQSTDTSDSDVTSAEFYAEVLPATATYVNLGDRLKLRERVYNVVPRVSWKAELAASNWDYDFVFTKKWSLASPLGVFTLFPRKQNILSSKLNDNDKKALLEDNRLMESVFSKARVPWGKQRLRKVTDFQKLSIPRPVLVLLGAIPFLPDPSPEEK